VFHLECTQVSSCEVARSSYASIHSSI